MADTNIDGAALPVDASGVRVVTHVYVNRYRSRTRPGAVVEVRKLR
jgi:hypothetical protein